MTSTVASSITDQVLGRLSDDVLLGCYQVLKTQLDEDVKAAGRLEQEIYRRMAERKATSIPDETFICEVEARNRYEQVSFGPLKEVFNEPDLVAALTPAHEETTVVPDKWKTSTVLSLARKYGAEAQRIVEQAKVPERPRLRFEKRHPANRDGEGTNVHTA